MSKLFSPLGLRSLELRNRIFVSPMCQYSSPDGLATDWHLVHLGSRAVGGAGLVMAEATAVAPEGRISPADLGLWSQAHAEALAPVARFIRERGAVPGIQLAHAGRKASTDIPWRSQRALSPVEGGWEPVAPSRLAFSPAHPTPRALDSAGLKGVVEQFTAAAQHALRAGFHVVELHLAHGYLLHEFLSPLSNERDDEYGGSLEHRARLPLEVAEAVRRVWPEELPLFARISATDWAQGGWELEQSVVLAGWLKEVGIDLIDCSSGGLVPDAKVPAGPGYQTPFSATLRERAGIATAAVGMITDPTQAEQIVATGLADAVSLAREFLRDPYWPLHAAQALGADLPWPAQYARAK